MFSLLDKNQTTPWQDQPLQYYMKFRVWYKELSAPGAAEHTDAWCPSFDRDLHSRMPLWIHTLPPLEALTCV